MQYLIENDPVIKVIHPKSYFYRVLLNASDSED